MIREVVTDRGAPAITSDQWHVVHSRFVGPDNERPFLRSIHSEHVDRTACREVARTLRAQLSKGDAAIPAEERDEVFVRKPNFRSLKRAKPARKDEE